MNRLFTNRIGTKVTLYAVGLVSGMLLGPFFHSEVTPKRAVAPASYLEVSVSDVSPRVRENLIAALEEMHPPTRRLRLRALAAKMASSDPAVAWAWQWNIPGAQDRMDFCQSVLDVWARKDVPGACAAVAGLSPGALRLTCLGALFRGWAQTTPLDALVAAEALRGPEKTSAITAALRAWAENAPADAIAWCLDKELSEGQEMRAAVEAWAEMDPDGASQWVESLAESVTRENAAAALVTVWGEQYPAEAAAWISSQGVSDSLDGPAITLAARWAEVDPAQATAWAASLSRTMTARTAAAQALGEWAVMDPLAAADWLGTQSLELPELATALRESLVSSWVTSDPIGALNWLDTLPNDPERESLSSRLFALWAAVDPEALEVWRQDDHLMKP